MPRLLNEEHVRTTWPAPRGPEGRQRYLDEAEVARLLDACGVSRNPYLTAIVTIAVNTGMRKSEVRGLTWERVDLASARITLYETKSGRPAACR